MDITMIVIIGLVALGLAFILFCLIRGKKNHGDLVEAYKDHFQVDFLIPAGIYLVYDLGLDRLLVQQIQNFHSKVVRLHGAKEGLQYTRMYIGQNIAVGMLVFAIVGVIAIAKASLGYLIVAIILAIIVPYLLFKEIDSKLLAKQRAITIALPEFLNKVLLLVNAGESLERAMMQAIRSGYAEEEKKLSKIKKDKDKKINPLYQELAIVLKELENNQPLDQVMEDLNKRVGIQEVSVATTTIVLNKSRGSSDFSMAMNEIIKELWDKRKTQVKTLGEEASSKLVFPMVIIFLVVAIIIATPAILSM